MAFRVHKTQWIYDFPAPNHFANDLRQISFTKIDMESLPVQINIPWHIYSFRKNAKWFRVHKLSPNTIIKYASKWTAKIKQIDIYIRPLSQIQCGKFGLPIEINKTENRIVFGLFADHTEGARWSKITGLIFLLTPRKMIIIR